MRLGVSTMEMRRRCQLVLQTVVFITSMKIKTLEPSYDYIILLNCHKINT